MPAQTKKNLFEGLPVEPIPAKAHVQKAHADLKKLLSEHSNHISERTLGVFLDTLNRIKEADSEAE
jgi:hypothetical protein